jgi:peptidoglycan/LPS O-acetylase OafA/YrhL
MADKKLTVPSAESERFYFPELDGLRFLAFLLVFVHHHDLFKTIPFLSVFNRYGWIGVDLFFVLSSYLFTKLLVMEHQKTGTISFQKFYIRRVFRIWPIYFVFVALSVLAVIWLGDFEHSRYWLIRVAGLLTFTDNIMTAIAGYNPISITSHLWTIGYEEQFYVFIPIVIFMLVRSSVRVRYIFFVTVCLLFAAIRWIMIVKDIPHPAVWVLPVTHFESMVLGVVVGFGGLNFLIDKLKPFLILLLGILFFSALMFLPGLDVMSNWLYLSYLLVGLSTTFVFYAVLKWPLLKDFFARKALVFLGKRSYGLYVYHLAAIEIAAFTIKKQNVFAEGQLWLSFTLALLLTIAISVLSYHVIEKPFLVLKKRFEVIISRPI